MLGSQLSTSSHVQLDDNHFLQREPGWYEMSHHVVPWCAGSHLSHSKDNLLQEPLCSSRSD